MITGIILIVVAIACLFYALYAFSGKEPLLSTAYLIATPAQREKMKTKSEYRFVAITFLLLSIIFMTIGLSFIYETFWLQWITFIAIGILIPYVIVGSIRNETKKK